jgi:hypothetical protein
MQKRRPRDCRLRLFVFLSPERGILSGFWPNAKDLASTKRKQFYQTVLIVSAPSMKLRRHPDHYRGPFSFFRTDFKFAAY